MGWLPGFEHDIFISYARVDNATAEGDPASGWVAQFHRRLDVALSKKIGRLDTIKIWRDTREIQGNELFDRTIQDAIRSSAVFVALSSHGYLQSKYCLQELAWFHQKAGEESPGLAAGEHYRIFNVLLNNIPPAEWPKEYGRTTGFPLHDATEPTRDGEPLDPGGDAFRLPLRAIVESLCETLTQLRANTGAAPEKAAEQNAFRIFMADTSDTLASIRKRVLNELKDKPGIQLVTNVPPPFEADPHDSRAAAELETADLSVHLLDAFPGREMADREGAFYPRRQTELALEHGKSQLIWVPQSLSRESIEDPRHSEFIDQLENGHRQRATYDFQRELPSSLTRQILAKVEELKAQRAVVAVSPDDMLLDTHIKDQAHAFELGLYLMKRQLRPFINSQEDDPAKNLQIFTEQLKKVGILVIFYGLVTEEWVRARLAIALQIAVAEGCPLRACAVYVAPPRKADSARKFSLPLLQVEWMDHTGGFNSDAVDNLLSRARAAGAR
jgi:hypothetical protein